MGFHNDLIVYSVVAFIILLFYLFGILYKRNQERELLNPKTPEEKTKESLDFIGIMLVIIFASMMSR